jgi:periplasmic protein TonB
MAFKSLLLSKDADLVQTLARLLKDLDVSVEPCSEPFAAAKRLMDQHFDAILVDCEDEQGAGWVLQSARMATASKKSVTIAIVGPQSASRGGPRAGENFVIQKPIVLKQVESTLRAARGLMADAGSPHSEAPPAASNMPAERPLSPVSTPQTPGFHTAQGRPPAEMFDELTAALDRLGPQPTPVKPVAAAPASFGSAAAAAPALEKPVPLAPAFEKPAPAAPAWEKPAAAAPAWEKPVAPAPAPERHEEAVAPPVLRVPQQSWPGLATATPSAPPKAEAPSVLPLAATAAEMKPAMRPAEEQARSNDALDNVRRRMNASAPPAWRTEVDEHRESPAPRFSTYAADERPSKGFPFKAIAVAMVLVSFALFGYSWYRGRHSTSTPGEQTQAPAAAPQQQQPVAEPGSALPQSAPVSSSAEMAGGSSNEAPTNPAIHAPKPSKPVPAGAAAETTAPDTTTDLEMPPAPLVVEGGKRQSNSSPQQAEAQLAPPTLDAVAGTAKPGLGGVVSSAKVEVPKLAAAPPPPQRIQVSQGVTQGLLVRQVKPQYPAMARETRVEGDVVLAAVIDKDGVVSDVRAISGPALLIPPALQAVRQWRYKPYLLNGQPVEVETQIKVQFRL